MEIDELTNCENCRFWSPVSGSLFEQKLANGECRRKSPVLVVSRGRVRLWPLTKADDWCGDFRRIESNARGEATE